MLQGFLQIFLTLLVVLLAPAMGQYLFRVFTVQQSPFDCLLNPLERQIYRLSGADVEENMSGREYAIAVVVSNTAMAIFVFLLLLFQAQLPFNLTHLAAPTWDTALHTAISFVVNADLQHYVPETTMSYFSQVSALGFLMFATPATGLTVSVALWRSHYQKFCPYPDYWIYFGCLLHPASLLPVSSWLGGVAVQPIVSIRYLVID